MFIMTEAAKSRLRMLRPEGRPGGEALRLDRATAAGNGNEPKLAVYLGEPEAGGRQPRRARRRAVALRLAHCEPRLQRVRGRPRGNVGGRRFRHRAARGRTRRTLARPLRCVGRGGAWA